MRYLIILCLVVILSSCSNSDELEQVDQVLSSEFFPLEIGHTTIYQVEEIIFDQRRQSKESHNFFLKEEISGQFMDDSGNTVYTVDRYTRTDVNNNWSYQKSWYSMISANQAIRIEENRRYIKLRLPVIQNDEWNGNALFDDSEPIIISGDPIDYYKNWSSRLISTDGAETVSGQSYPEVYKISLADYENKLEVRTGQEIYAKGIGLIYREIMVLDTQCFDDCDTNPWIEKAQNGHIYIQTIYNQ